MQYNLFTIFPLSELRVEKWSRSVQHLFLIFTQSSYRIRQCFRSSMIQFVPHVFPIFSVILTKYHYIILTDYPGIQFHRYIS
jgi:hypothetical protein